MFKENQQLQYTFSVSNAESSSLSWMYDLITDGALGKSSKLVSADGSSGSGNEETGFECVVYLFKRQ